MGVLARSAVVALTLTSCYSPSIRDCTVSCMSPGDCANGQICGSDGWCAAPRTAGRCMVVDAGARDADATAAVALHVKIAGKGSVFIDGVGVCSSRDPQRGDCMYSITAGVEQTAHAVEIASDERFATWTSENCAGQPARCVFTPTASSELAARFTHVALHADDPR